MRNVFICTPLVLSALVVHAQSSVELDNVTVTASLFEQQQKETGRNIYVVQGQRFYNQPVHSLDELLRYLPGVEVQQRGPQGAQSNILLRGGTFQQVLILIDGVKLNDPLTGHFNSYLPINAAEIERIEILKGAASAVFGSEAVGGVINIITKTFNKQKEGNKIVSRNRVGAGDYRLLNAESYGYINHKNNVVSGGVQTNNAKGPLLRGTNGFFHLTSATTAFSPKLKHNWQVSFRTAIDNRRFNAQNFYTTFSVDTASEKVNSWWSQLNIRKKLNKGSLNFDAAFKKLRDLYRFRPSVAPNDNRTNLFTTQAFYTTDLSKHVSITSGVQFHRKEIKSNDRGYHSLWHGAAYAIFRQKLKESFHFTESIRVDWDENYGTILVPQFNLAFVLPKVTLRASGGRSFRDADFTERFNNYNKALVTAGSIGNPQLTPEQSWNFEAGSDLFLFKGLKISTTFFYRKHKNLIDWKPTAYADMPRKENLIPAGTYSLAKNIEKINTAGIELDISYDRKINDHTVLWGSAGYTWLNSKNNDPVPSFYISSHARHLLNFSSSISYKKFQLGLNGLFKERNARQAAAIQASITPTYFIAGLKMGYLISSIKGKLYLQADNIFNKTYSDLLGSRMPGRWLSGGIEIAL